MTSIKLGPEAARMYSDRLESGFFDKYMSGDGLDIGYKGSNPDAVPILHTAAGVDTDYPGYDGVNLLFESESQDYVHASHVLEHLDKPVESIAEWFRVLKPGGYLVIMVPHKYLYEKKHRPPSNFNPDHKRFYTPSFLLHEIESSLFENSYRVRLLEDGDHGYTYHIGPELHCGGQCEIILVLQKIVPPKWNLELSVKK